MIALHEITLAYKFMTVLFAFLSWLLFKIWILAWSFWVFCLAFHFLTIGQLLLFKYFSGGTKFYYWRPLSSSFTLVQIRPLSFFLTAVQIRKNVCLSINSSWLYLIEQYIQYWMKVDILLNPPSETNTTCLRNLAKQSS